MKNLLGGIPSPNPSYPQNIDVVTGEQKVKVENVNLANEENIQIGKAWNNSSNSARAILVIPIEHNTQYTISYGSLGSIEGVYYGYRTDEETAGTGVSQVSTNPTTITTNDTNNYIIFQFNKTSISLADIQALNLQLEKGSTATTYTPHQEQDYTINLGKNLYQYDTTNLYTTSQNGAYILQSGIDTTYINATQQDNGFYVNTYNNNNYRWYSLRVDLPKNTNLRFTCGDTNISGDTNMKIYGFSSLANGTTGTLISNLQNNTTFNSGNYNYYLFGFYPYQTGRYAKNIMIANSNSTTDFAEYFTPIELARIPNTNYKDYIYKDNGKWYIEKNIGHKKASEIIENNIGLVSQGVSIYNTGVKSDRTLQVYSNVQTWKNSTDTEWNTLNGNYIGILYNVSQIYINKTASASSEIKTWLESLNFEMYYVLSTPTYEEITNETLINELEAWYNGQSYNGTTNISSSGNLPAILSVSAIKGE